MYVEEVFAVVVVVGVVVTVEYSVVLVVENVVGL